MSDRVLLASSSMLLVVVLSALPLRADDKKADSAKDAPRILMSLPLGQPAGVAGKVVLRGLKLDSATLVRCSEPKATVKLLKKSKAGAPDKLDPKKVGDTQIEIELNVPAELAGKTVELSAVTPAGVSAPYELLVDAPGSVIQEKEPNNGFRQAQPVAVPATVDGTIGQNQDVDVYRIEGKVGQTIVVDVLAARRGSALDSTLLFHDADAQLLASNDDHAGSLDSHLEVKLPRDGAYFATVMDAHDTGGPLHVYRLSIKAK